MRCSARLLHLVDRADANDLELSVSASREPMVPFRSSERTFPLARPLVPDFDMDFTASGRA